MLHARFAQAARSYCSTNNCPKIWYPGVLSTSRNTLTRISRLTAETDTPKLDDQFLLWTKTHGSAPRSVKECPESAESLTQ